MCAAAALMRNSHVSKTFGVDRAIDLLAQAVELKANTAVKGTLAPLVNFPDAGATVNFAGNRYSMGVWAYCGAISAFFGGELARSKGGASALPEYLIRLLLSQNDGFLHGQDGFGHARDGAALIITRLGDGDRTGQAIRAVGVGFEYLIRAAEGAPTYAFITAMPLISEIDAAPRASPPATGKLLAAQTAAYNAKLAQNPFLPTTSAKELLGFVRYAPSIQELQGLLLTGLQPRQSHSATRFPRSNGQWPPQLYAALVDDILPAEFAHMHLWSGKFADLTTQAPANGAEAQANLQAMVAIFRAGYARETILDATLTNPYFNVTHANVQVHIHEAVVGMIEALSLTSPNLLADAGMLEHAIPEIGRWAFQQVNSAEILEVYKYWTAVLNSGQFRGAKSPVVLAIASAGLNFGCAQSADAENILKTVGMAAAEDANPQLLELLVAKAAVAVKPWFRSMLQVGAEASGGGPGDSRGVTWSKFEKLLRTNEGIHDDVHIPVVSALLEAAVVNYDLSDFEDWMALPLFWLGFVAWAGMCVKSGPATPIINETLATMRDTLKQRFKVLKSGAYSVVDLEFLEGRSSPFTFDPARETAERLNLLASAFAVTGSRSNAKEILSLQRETVDKLLKSLVHAKKVCEHYFVGSPYEHSCADIHSNFDHIEIREVATFLQMPNTGFPPHTGSLGAYTQLPELLGVASSWLERLLPSKLFAKIWEDCKKDSLVPGDFAKSVNQHAELARGKWVGMSEQFLNQTITFNELDEIMPMLGHDELKAMAETNVALATGLGGKTDPYATAESKEEVALCEKWAASIGVTFAEYKEFLKLHTDLPHIIEALGFFGTWLTAAGKRSTTTLMMRLEHLHARLGENWGGTTLLAVGGHIRALQEEQAVLTSISGMFRDTRFMRALTSSGELLDWLRLEFSVEQNFVSAIERTQNTERALLGPRLRANLDGTLSDLARVRLSLFEFIYRESAQFGSLELLLAELKKLDHCVDDAELHLSMARCDAMTLELADVMASDQRDLAPKRLAAYLEEEKKARWTVCMPPEGKAENDEWTMEECINMVFFEEGTEVSVNFEALLEFQSSLVLAKGSVGNLQQETQIEKWLAQFWRMQDLGKTLYDLQTSGHFDYTNAKVSFRLTETASSMVDRRLYLAEQLSDWETAITNARDKYYFLTFLTTRQITRLASYLLERDEGKLMDSMRVIHPAVTEEQVRRCRSKSGMVNLGVTDDVYTRLNFCGMWLDGLFGDLPPVSRDVPAGMVNLARNLLILNPGVNMAVVDEVDDLILTAYVTEGHLPEAPELLICSRDTSWEEVHCFLQRWKGAITNARGTRMYCLAKADRLADGVQRKTSAVMMKYERNASVQGFADGGGLCKLLVVNTSDKGSLCSDFNHRRLRSYTPPELESDVAGDFTLRTIGSYLATTYVGSVAVYSGARSGCGKSFAIRCDADGEMDSWAVHKKVGARDFVQSVPPQAHKPLHISISSSADASLNDLLFQMLVVGSIQDADALVEHVWKKGRTHVYIEVASTALFEKMRILNVMPQKVLSVNSFATTAMELNRGMGELDFKSARYDGTEPLGSPAAADAATRLQYICKVLQVLDSGQQLGGQESTFLSRPDVSAEECFRLLCTWADQGDHPSFISMWSFVNCIFFQMKSMHHATSIFTNVLNNRMYMDQYPGLKNNVVKFMIHTALDFAPHAPPDGNGDCSGIVQWNDSNHNFLLQQHKGTGGFTLLARDKAKLFAAMEGNLKDFLVHNRLDKTVGESGHMLTEFVGILSKTTGIKRTEAEVLKLGGGRFVVTYDTILKMIAIYTRIRCGIPVVLMGECGCGKTALLNYISDYLNVTLINLDIHGGTTASDIVQTIMEAEALNREVYVFLDEINTCSEMGLLTEIIVNRSVNGRKISENLSIVAALNPYRLKPESMRSAGGLVFQLHSSGAEATPDPMADLVYKVHPVPGTLLEYCFEFGSLSTDIEKLYIYSMIGRCIPQATEASKRFYSELLSCAQIFLRTDTGETSVVSLRDVQRAIDLLSWFSKTGKLPALKAQHDEISSAFMSDAISDADAATETFVQYLQNQSPTSMEGVLAASISDATLTGFPRITQSSKLAELSAYLSSQNTAARYVKMARDCFLKWAGVKAGMSEKFVSARDYLSIDIAITANGQYNAQGLACIVKVHQSQDGKKDATAAVEIRLDWPAQDVEPGHDKVVHQTRRIHLSQPFVKVELAQRGTGHIHIRTTPDQTVTNIRVENDNGVINNRPAVLAIAHVYYYRLDNDTARTALTDQIVNVAMNPDSSCGENGAAEYGEHEQKMRTEFSKPNYFEKLLDDEQGSYMDNMEIEEGIARNKALKENLFVVLTCILNHIPVMVVGKPGTSKTLCMQLIIENLRGTGSRNDFWKQYPSITVFPYQCSPLSTAASIQKQFDAAEAFANRQGSSSIVVLLLDEIGLAEYSPDMPLKVLHAMLMSRTVAIVGISNWMLDPAKMNRAVCLRRPDLPRADLTLTGKAIVGEELAVKSGLAAKAGHMADAYHEIYTNQPGRDYLGMRDYYSLLKFLGREIRHKNATFDEPLLQRALCRNFAGKASTHHRALKLFGQKCGMSAAMSEKLPVVSMINENLNDRESRHLMVLTKNSAAWSILKTLRLVDPQNTTLLVGSQFPEDASELQLIQQLNAVKRAMATGSTLVLLNHDNMYEALYDVLNQRYVTEKTSTGVETRMLRVAVGMRSALCTVHDDFKLICIVEARHAYEKLDLPLLNRFEKQLLNAMDVLSAPQIRLVDYLQDFVEECSAEAGGMPIDDMFCGFDGDATLASLVLSLKLETNSRASRQVAVAALARIATPLAMISVSNLLNYKDEYFKTHGSFAEYCVTVLGETGTLGVSKLSDAAGSVGVVLTYSPEMHLVEALADAKNQPLLAVSETHVESCVLNSFQSGDSFREKVRKMHDMDSVKPAILLVQCDPIHVSQSHIRHAIAICDEETERRANMSKDDIADPSLLDFFYNSEDPTIQTALSQGRMPSFPRHVVFIVHLPPGMRSRRRHFPLDFLLAPSVFFLDDLRPSVYGTITPEDMLFRSMHDLISNGKLDLWARLETLYGAALQRLRVPFPGTDAGIKRGVHLYPTRMKTMETLMGNKMFQERIIELMNKVFERPAFCQMPPLQHSVAISGRVAGSLRERCSIALDEIILQLFALILSRMERNFGLSALSGAIEQRADSVQTLWWIVSDATAESMAKITPQDVLDGSRIDVKNDGVENVFIARFPSSYAFIAFCDTEEFKENLIKTHGSGGEAESMIRQILAAHFKSYFGDDVVDAIQAYGKSKDHVDYLLDYMSMKCPVFAGVDEADHLAVYRGTIESFHAGGMRSLSGIHVAVWLNEKRLFHYCSIVEIAVRFNLTALKDQLLNAMGGSGAKPGVLECDKRVMSVLLASLQELQDRTFASSDASDLQLWPAVVETLQVHMEGMLLMLKDGCEAAMMGNEASIIEQQWNGVRVVQLFLSEVVTPTLVELGEGRNVTRIISNALGEFVALAPSCSTHDYDFLESLCKCVVSICANLDLAAALAASFTASFLRRYLIAMVFGKESKAAAGKILDFTMDLVKGKTTILPRAVQQDLSLRRSVLYHLFESKDSNMTANTRKKVVMSLYKYAWSNVPCEETPDFSALQLYAELKEFQIRNGLVKRMLPLDADDTVARGQNRALVGAHSADKKSLLPSLDAFVHARVAMLNHCKTLLKHLESGNVAPDESGEAGVLSRILHDPAAEPWRDYFLRSFYAEGRIGQLKILLENRGVLTPWLQLESNAVSLTKRVETPFDPFGLLFARKSKFLPSGEPVNYQNMNFAVENALAAKSGREAEDFRRYCPDDLLIENDVTTMMIGSVYSAAYTKYANEPAEVIYPHAKALEQHILAKSDLQAPATEAVCGFLENFPMANGKAKELFQMTSTSMADQLIKTQVIAELFAFAYSNQGSFFWRCFAAPETLVDEFVPTMPANEMKMIQSANIRDITKWYQCDNGHPFSIGNCGMAMVTARCHCGAKIGGSHHNLDHGRAADIDKLAAQDDPGYNKEFVQSPSTGDIMRDSMGVFSVRIVRLFFHGMMQLACATGGAERARQLVGYTSAAQTSDFVAEQFNKDWEACKESAEVNNESLGLFLSAVLANCRRSGGNLTGSSKPTKFTKSSDREKWERDFERMCVTPLVAGGKAKQNIEKHSDEVAKFCPMDQKTVVMQMVGTDKFKTIQGDAPGGALSLEGELLRYSLPITFAHFMRGFKMNPDNVEKYPTLALITEVEEDLAIIKYLPAVLAWHGILFEAFGDGVSREDAQATTNEDAILRLPDRRHTEARRIFALFAEGFSLILPTIDTIFECQKNPFKQMVMESSTPITFSLPNEKALEGCCTIRLLSKLHKAHNDVLMAYAEHLQADAKFHPSKNTETPSIDYRTPYKTARSKVIEYSREANLIPLVLMYNTQSLDYEEGHDLGYDLAKVETVLTTALLKDKSPINLLIRRFEYKGEMRKGTALTTLVQNLPQQELADETREAIGTEIDTQYKTKILLNFLEEVIEFISAISHGGRGGVLPPGMPLVQYVTQSMLVPEDRFAAKASPTVLSAVCLCHLQSLFFFLEENANGSFLDKILPQYRAPLTDDQRDDLLRAQPHLDTAVCLNAMRELMLESPGLLNEPGPGPELGLRDFLDFIDPGDDVNDSMDEIESYDTHFPRSLTIGTCLAAYQLLTNASVDLLETTEAASGGLASGPASRANSRPSRQNSTQNSTMVPDKTLSGASQILAFAAAQRAAQQAGAESHSYGFATANPMAAYRAPGFFDDADLDGDGMLSLSEAKAKGMTVEIFREIDADGDGQLTLEEFTAWKAKHGEYIAVAGGGGGGGGAAAPVSRAGGRN